MTPDEIILELISLYEQGLTSENKPHAADLIQQLRHELKLTLREFTRPLGTSPQTAHRWEHGLSVPNQTQLTRLRKAYSQDQTPLTVPITHAVIISFEVTGEDLLQTLVELERRLRSISGSPKIRTLSINPKGRL